MTSKAKPKAASQRAAILPGGDAGQRHHEDQRDAAGSERQAGRGRRVTQQLLRELRLQHGVGVEHAAYEHHEEATDGEVLVAEEAQVDQRILLVPLPNEETDDADDEENSRRSR